MADPKPCNLIGRQRAFHIAINHVASCCVAYHEELDTNKSINDYVTHWQEQKKLLEQGIKIPQCELCWKTENQNKISIRQQSLNTQIPDNLYELEISNACNQMCSYCSPKYSSTWQSSIETQGMFKNVSLSAQKNQQLPSTQINTEHWLDKIQQHIATCEDRTVVLKLLGGEPLMQNRNLQELLEFDSAKVKLLQIHTNLSPPNNKFLRWVLENFEPNRLKFIVSLDSTPEYNNIPRGKFNADEFNTNLALIKKSGVDFYIMSVLSVLSIFDLKNFILWLESNQITSVFQKLNNPECLDPGLVPLGIRQKIYAKFAGVKLPDVVVEVLTQDTVQSTVRLFEQYNYLTQYFERVNIEVSSIKNSLFQEYWTWLSSKYSKNLSTYS